MQGDIDAWAKARGIWPLCGTDEAGRGPLAGPVVAAAVILPDGARLPGLDDSKKLPEAERERLDGLIRRCALGFGVYTNPPDRIDTINILQASLEAMARAVEQCVAMALGAGAGRPALVVVDGNKETPYLSGFAQRAFVGGDGRSRAIAAASVLAKVARDRIMVALDATHPGYGFAVHKGYPTPAHLDALHRLGPCPIHRRSFRPVSEAG